MLNRLGRPTFLKFMVMLASTLQLPVYRVCGKKPGLPKCCHTQDACTSHFTIYPCPSFLQPTQFLKKASCYLLSKVYIVEDVSGCQDQVFQGLPSSRLGPGLCNDRFPPQSERFPNNRTWAQPRGWPLSHQCQTVQEGLFRGVSRLIFKLRKTKRKENYYIHRVRSHDRWLCHGS